MNDLNSNEELEGGEGTKSNGIPKEKTFDSWEDPKLVLKMKRMLFSLDQEILKMII